MFEERTEQAGLSVTPLSQRLGAQIKGFDFSKPAHRPAIELLRDLADAYLVLLFRGHDVDEEQHVRFSLEFGDLIPPVEPKFTSKTEPMILHLGNVSQDRRKLPNDDPAVAFTYAPERWHSDGSYKLNTNYLTILHALEIPPEGGETWFGSMLAAWEDLPEGRKRLLEGRSMEHPYPYRDAKIKNWEGNAIEVVKHPMVRTSPLNEKFLFLSSFGGKVDGMSDDEGSALVAELFDYGTREEFIYRHKYQVGDTLMWTNRGAIHCGQTWDRTRHRRLLQRTEVAGVG